METFIITIMIITATIGLALYKLRRTKPHPIFYLEGNIGAGKSTLANGLAACGKYRVRKEPVAEWQNTGGYNLLALLGLDRQKWLYVFQTLVLATLTKRVRQIEKPTEGKPCILERSANCALKVFARDGHEQGFLSNEEMAVLKMLHETLADKSQAVYIYVRTPPEISYERMAARGRTEEKRLPEEYFVRLHTLMDQWLMQEETAPVIVINGLESPSEILREATRKIEEQLQKYH